jgi:hypothetical protein
MKIRPSHLYVELIDDSLPRCGVSNDIIRHVIRVPLTENQKDMLEHTHPHQMLRAISVQPETGGTNG